MGDSYNVKDLKEKIQEIQKYRKQEKAMGIANFAREMSEFKDSTWFAAEADELMKLHATQMCNNSEYIRRDLSDIITQIKAWEKVDEFRNQEETGSRYSKDDEERIKEATKRTYDELKADYESVFGKLEAENFPAGEEEEFESIPIEEEEEIIDTSENDA